MTQVDPPVGEVVPPEGDQPPEGTPDPDVTPTPPSRRQAAADNERIVDLEKENKRLRLDNLLTGAGIDPTSGGADLFRKGYDGEMTQEAVTAAIASAGIGNRPPPQEGDEIGEEERQSTEERQRLARGATPDGGTPSEDPRVAAVKAGDQVLESGGTQEAAMGRFFDTVAHAGYGGDRRAQWWPGKDDPRRPDQGW